VLDYKTSVHCHLVVRLVLATVVRVARMGHVWIGRSNGRGGEGSVNSQIIVNEGMSGGSE
jgi:hypothetical protein